MKIFHFRLEHALRVRRAQLQAAEAKLKELLGQEERLRRSLATTAEERLDACCRLQQQQVLDTLDVRSLSAYIVGLQSRAVHFQQALEKTLELILEQRRRLLILEQNEKLLANLRDKKLADWQREANHQIEEAAQESWLARFANRRKNSEES